MNSGRGNAMNGRSKIRYGMVGGGEGAFIGAVHRMADALDSEYEVVCGAFSADADRNRRSAEVLGLDPGRDYATFDKLLAAEAAVTGDERMEVLAFRPEGQKYELQTQMRTLYAIYCVEK